MISVLRRPGAAAVSAFLFAVTASAQTSDSLPLPPLEGHWQCMDIVTNGGTTDYYEFDFNRDGTQTTAYKASGGIFTGRGSWTLDTQNSTLVHLTAPGELCNKYGFRCRDFTSRMNFEFEITSSHNVDFRTNGVIVRCQSANGRIDVDNWMPSSLDKFGSILDVLGNAMERAADKGMQYQQMMNGGGMGYTGASDGTDAAAMGIENTYNEQDAAAAHASEAAKQRRINFLHWFIAKNEQTLQNWQASLQRQESQPKPPNAYVLSGNRRNIDRLQTIVDKAKRELSQLEN